MKNQSKYIHTIKSRIKQISIRGRVALGIRCIEIYAKEINVNEHLIINQLTSILWDFTSSNELDEWHEKIVEFDPDNIIVDVERDQIDDLEYLTKEELINQYNFYKELPFAFIQLISWVIETGTCNLYGGTGEYSKPSFEATLKFINYFNRSGKQLPPLEIFERSSFKEFHGWGNNRSKRFFYEAKL